MCANSTAGLRDTGGKKGASRAVAPDLEPGPAHFSRWGPDSGIGQGTFDRETNRWNEPPINLARPRRAFRQEQIDESLRLVDQMPDVTPPAYRGKGPEPDDAVLEAVKR